MLDRLLAIEKLNTLISAISSWALLGMTLIVGFEVMSRYFFNAPTIWAWDINVQLMLLLLMLGMAEAYRRDVHVRVDVLTSGLSDRSKAVIEVLLAPVFLLVAVIIAWTGWEYFLDSYNRNQTASTIFAPLLWPIKFTLPLGGALLVLQGVVKLIRDIRIVIHGHRAESGRV
jgi:TRAP-type mannitol/chloroaromatic compound transport system permease small subunit